MSKDMTEAHFVAEVFSVKHTIHDIEFSAWLHVFLTVAILQSILFLWNLRPLLDFHSCISDTMRLYCI